MLSAGGILDRCAAGVWWVLEPIYVRVHSMAVALVLLSLLVWLVLLGLGSLRLLVSRSEAWKQRVQAEVAVRLKRPKDRPSDPALQRDLAAARTAHPLPPWAVGLLQLVDIARKVLIGAMYLGCYRLFGSQPALRDVPLLWLWRVGESPPLLTLFWIALALGVVVVSQLALASLSDATDDVEILPKLGALLVAGFLPAGLVYFYIVFEGLVPFVTSVTLLVVALLARALRSPQSGE